MKGLTGNNPANDPDKKPMKAYSHFKPNYSLYYTALFGMCTPNYAAQVVPDDKNFSIRSAHDIDTANLRAPIMTPVKFHKDYFMVPIRAILPNTADLIVTNPLQGDDVVFPDVQPALDVKQLLSKLKGFIYYAKFPLQNTGGSYTPAQVLAAYSDLYQMSKWFLSRDSLLNRLGISLCSAFVGPIRDRDGKYLSIDQVLEHMTTVIKNNLESFEVVVGLPEYASGSISYTTKTFKVYPAQEYSTFFGAGGTNVTAMCLRDYLELLWTYPIVQVKNVVVKTGSDWDGNSAYIPYINGTEHLNSYIDFDIIALDLDENDKYRNISRLVAYQLACAHFFTNDGVDAVYNEQLWHQNQLALILKGTHSFADRFDYNGVGYQYDSVCGSYLNQLFSYTALSLWDYNDLATAGDTDPRINGYNVADAAYVMNIFSPQRSLKFRDYFVGSKVRPLAVGNVDVTVNSNLVSVIDVTKNIMRQKFLNQVNRLGRSLKEYSRGIFGVTPMATPNESIYLGGTVDIVGAEETDNTAEDMLTQDFTTRTKLRSNASRFAFQLDQVGEFSWIIGITHFEVARPYVDVTDRETFQIDRFEMFNPYMQQIGDQPVLNTEIVPARMLNATTAKENFGYQLRYAEYKQRVDRAVGGFADFLPGFAFLNDEQSMLPLLIDKYHLGSDFLRAKPREFDQFFNALTLYSPAGYFHFIIRDDFEVNADRPMLSAPTIL